MTTRVATKDLKPGDVIDLGGKQGWREVLSKSAEKHAMTPGYRLVMSDPQIVKFPVWAAADKKWETQMDTNETKAPAPQSEAPEVGEDALDNETARKDWVRSIYKQIDAEDAAELSVEPRTEAQPPTDLVGDGKRMPEKKRAPKAEPRTPGVIEALANLKVDELGPIEALTKLYELKRLATKEWTAEGVEFAGDDPLATADLVHQVEGLQTDLQAEKDRAAAQERQYQEQIAEMTVAWMADERAANAQITALGQAAADGQALMAAARVIADVIERAKKTPEATAPQSVGPYKVTNGVKP